MSINTLPNELLRLILSHCCVVDTDREMIAKVCHHWSDVVQSQRNCLHVSVRPNPSLRNSRTVFIGKRILQRSTRQYACLNVEWRHKESERNMQNLSDLLDICEERSVALQRLFLRAPPSVTLVQFFTNRHAWLKGLVELHVKLETTAPGGPSVGTGVYEVSFPHLREVSWYEYKVDGGYPAEWGKEGFPFIDADSCQAIALNAPELRRLTVGMIYSLKRSNLESRLRDVDACCLFLPTLELKPCRNLEAVTIEGLYSISQRCVDNSERLLQNLRVLSFTYCHGDVIQRICRKCPNLKELTIEEPPSGTMSLQISPVLSACLEHLTIKSEDSYFHLNDRAVFPKLQSICLNYVILDENVTLVAPQLSKFETRYTEGARLTIPHVEQIRTLKVYLCDESIHVEAPLPNVTRLYLYLTYPRNEENHDQYNRLLENYLVHSVNVKRLTIEGSYYPQRILDLSFVEHLQHFEWFCAYDITIRLIDISKLVGLKTLILRCCTLKVEPTDDEVSLTALEYVRMHYVSVRGDAFCGTEDRFPIRLNERQPPIQLVRDSFERHRVFSSKSS